MDDVLFPVLRHFFGPNRRGLIDLQSITLQALSAIRPACRNRNNSGKLPENNSDPFGGGMRDFIRCFIMMISQSGNLFVATFLPLAPSSPGSAPIATWRAAPPSVLSIYLCSQHVKPLFFVGRPEAYPTGAAAGIFGGSCSLLLLDASRGRFPNASA